MSKKKSIVKNGLVRKEFQKEMSKLKKAGLIPKTVDIRKMPITKHYLSVARKFKDIISGTATTTPIKSKKALEILKDRGERIVTESGSKRKLLVTAVNPSDKVRLTTLKDGTVKRTYKRRGADGQIYTVVQRELPVKFENIEQWMNDLQNKDFELKKGEKIIFFYRGNYSRNSYASFSDAVKKFMTYEVFIKAMNGELSAKDSAELMKSIGFETITADQAATYNRDRVTKPSMQFDKASKKRHNNSRKRGYGTKGV